MNLDELRNIKPKYSLTELKGFDDEESFMDAYVELLKKSITLLYLTVGERYCKGEEGLPKKINRDEAIVAGNLTRLIKLNTSFIENICNRKLEICYILLRCIAETAINTQYMLIEGEEGVFVNYIKYSLITEKKLLETIQENVSEREGKKLHIEHRMQTSIEYSFENSDFDLGDVNKSSKWKSIAERAKEVAGDQFYKVFYGEASHSIHDNWQDILMNNLSKNSDGFEINLKWNRPRPQIMDAAIILNLLVAKKFVEKEKLDNKEIYDEKFKLLMEYLESILLNHEEFLKK